MVNKDIELLAPVGSMEALYAAVQNGANAVYLGGKVFSARQYANNFDLEELKSAVEYAHIRNVKVYITVNILIDDGEMEEALEFIKYLYEIDVDGLILQDLGMAYLIGEIFPDFHLHGSTQMTVNNLPGVQFLEKLGLSRVVLAREVPLEEIKKIHENSHIELEGFIHGALCVSYSGQCLMSSIIGGRSGNRGRCAQPCRMAYSLIDYESKNILSDKWGKKYLLSTRDLNTIDYIEDIINSGIISLKIEGRMKRSEYVATIVKNYRKALDSGSKTINSSEKEDILQIFNREFTKGMMLGDFGRNFTSIERPDNRGEASEELLNKAKASYEEENIKYPINLKMVVSIGKPPVLNINHEQWNIKVESKSIVDSAKNLPLTEERIIEQLSKLNDTVYYIDNIDIDLEDGAFMSLSEINGLRRDGVEKLDKMRKNFNNRDAIDQKKYRAFVEKYFKYDKKDHKSQRKISVKVSNRTQLNQLNMEKLDRIYIDFDEDLDKIIPAIKDKNKEIYLSTGKILYEKDLNKLGETIDANIQLLDGISVSNIGTLKFVMDNFNTNIHGDIGLNAFNSFTSKLLKEYGVNSLTLSPELNMGQIENINKSYNSYETIGYGYLPLMTMGYCPMSTIKNCKDSSQCETCAYRKGYGLRDRMNVDFYTERKNGITTIYNSVPLMVLDSLDTIYNVGVDTIRLDFTFEKNNIREIQEVYYDYAKGNISKRNAEKFLEEYRSKNHITKGHYFRGVI